MTEPGTESAQAKAAAKPEVELEVAPAHRPRRQYFGIQQEARLRIVRPAWLEAS